MAIRRLRQPVAPALAMVALVGAIALKAQSTVPAIFEVPNGAGLQIQANSYHLETCPLVQHFILAPVDVAAARRRRMVACETCKPLSNQALLKLLTPPPVRKISEADARAFLRTTLVELADPQYQEAVKDLIRSKFNVLFAQQAKAISEDFTGDPIVVTDTGGLEVFVMGPALSFSRRAAEKLRTLDPKPQVVWSGAVEIVVNPTTIDALDIVRVVLRSGDATVPPIENRILPRKLQTRMGATAVINAGAVLYPSSVFKEDATLLQLMLIPRSGENILHLFTREELRRIQ